VGREIATSLRDFAVALETQLPGLEMVHAVEDRTQLARFLPRLTQLLEEQALLLVLDNLESLLTNQSAWRDPRWDQLVPALTRHRGESRVVLTSRVRPQGLDERMLAEPVHALSLDEALLLARELPNLGRLIRQDTADLIRRRDGASLSGWTLVRHTLAVVQGHPKLLELADALAKNPEVLAGQLAVADQATTAPERDRLKAFFEQGQTDLAEGHFVRVLGDWTRQAAQILPPTAVVLFGMLCCLEDPDRTQPVVEPVWPMVWQQLGQPDAPPALSAALMPLVEAGLVAAEGDPVGYRIHSGVAEAGREHAGGRVQQVVDTVVTDFWQRMFRQAIQAEGGEAGALLLRAAHGAVPYLLRLEAWATASQLLDQIVLTRDRSPGMVQAVLPLLRRIAEATRGTDQELINAGRLASVLRWVDPKAAEERLREVLARAVDQQQFDVAGAVAGHLANLLGTSAGSRRPSPWSSSCRT
jgi:hypothetical protein